MTPFSQQRRWRHWEVKALLKSVQPVHVQPPVTCSPGKGSGWSNSAPWERLGHGNSRPDLALPKSGQNQASGHSPDSPTGQWRRAMSSCSGSPNNAASFPQWPHVEGDSGAGSGWDSPSAGEPVPEQRALGKCSVPRPGSPVLSTLERREGLRACYWGKLPRPTARRALSEGREVPQAAFPSCCLAMQTQR